MGKKKKKQKKDELLTDYLELVPLLKNAIAENSVVKDILVAH
jgi:hypothetical protein